MDDPKAIINLGELAKPATVLIEKISEAIGGIFRPYQIKRVAQAEAEAEKIKAMTQVELTDLHRRAMYRFIAEEAKKQDNIETITRKALPELKAEASPERVENDWITNFFDKCRLISDDQMQELWARVLAGEANAPRTFSKRTVDLLASLDKSDAVSFSRLCSFGVFFDELDETIPLVYDIEEPIYGSHGLDFFVLSELDSIGLIRFDEKHVTTWDPSRRGLLRYFDYMICLDPVGKRLELGGVILTKSGQELASICNPTPIMEFLEYLRGRWSRAGYKVDDLPNGVSRPKPSESKKRK
jgi:hypothetical protein